MLKKFRSGAFYTILWIMIYGFVVSENFNDNLWLFNQNEADTKEIIVNIILVIFYIIGILFIIFRKPNLKAKDEKMLKFLNMKIPTESDYNRIIKEIENIYIRTWNLVSYKYRFYVSDLEGNLLYKVKQIDGLVANIYNVYDPYDNILAEIKVKLISLMPNFEINIPNKVSFEIKRNLQLMDTNYEIKDFPFKINGDFFGFEFSILSTNDDNILADIDNIMADGMAHNGNSDIIVYDNTYLLEIVCLSICTILGKISLSKKND